MYVKKKIQHLAIFCGTFFKQTAKHPCVERARVFCVCRIGMVINMMAIPAKPERLAEKNQRWIRPEPSPPASFSTSATVTML